MTDEKLLSIRDVSTYLGLTQEQIKELVSKSVLPAYRIAGSFLRFNKDEVDLAKPRIDEYISKSKAADSKGTATKGIEDAATIGDRIIDFFYFNSFYIIATLIVGLVLVLIFT